RAPAKIAHRRKDLLDGGCDAIDGELDGGGQIGNAGFQDWTQELALRYGAVLEDLDGAQLVSCPLQRPRQRLGVADARSEAARVESDGAQVSRQGIESIVTSRNQRDVESFGAELSG